MILFVFIHQPYIVDPFSTLNITLLLNKIHKRNAREAAITNMQHPSFPAALSQLRWLITMSGHENYNTGTDGVFWAPPAKRSTWQTCAQQGGNNNA